MCKNILLYYQNQFVHVYLKQRKRKGKKKKKKKKRKIKQKEKKEEKQRTKGIYIFIIVLVEYNNIMYLNLYIFYTTEYYSHCNLTMLKYIKSIITSILYYNKSNQL